MNETLHISYKLTEKHWREFYNAYYVADKRFKLRFLYGTATWLVGVFGLIGLFDNKPIAFGMILFGLYCVFIKQYLINKAIKKLKTNPRFPGEIEYFIDQDRIHGTDQGKEFEFTWDMLHGYRDTVPGLLFYLEKAAFFFIPKAAIPPEEKQKITAVLALNKVPNLAAKR